MSDAYSYQAQAEIVEKFDLNEKEAGKIVQKAWKLLSLEPAGSPSSGSDYDLEDLIARG